MSRVDYPAPGDRIKTMPRSACLTLLALAAASCGWFGSSPVTPDDAGTDGDAGPCTSNEQCSDNEPCNGEEVCQDGVCGPGVSLPDETPCATPLGADGRCIEELCIPLTCGNGTVQEGEECDDANAAADDGCERNCLYSCHHNEDCDNASPCTLDLCNSGGTGRICEHEPQEGDCDDGLFCTRGDRCDALGECTGTDDTCDDGLSCTSDVCYEDGDFCSNSILAGSCRIDGACYTDGLTDPANPCRGCDSEAASEAWTPRPAGSDCSDGFSCTLEACDGAGLCDVTREDSLCGGEPGLVCEPACFPGTATGCGRRPGSLLLSCDAFSPDSDTAACHISLDGLEGQAGCLACESKVGVVVLDRTDFGDAAGTCDFNGWELVTAAECCDVMDVGCAGSVCTMPCCTDSNDVCRREDDTWALQLGERRCGTEEARVHKTFDTSGLEAVQLCFELASERGRDGDYALVQISDPAHAPEQVFCLAGEVQPGVNREYYPYCLDLPSWAGNNTALTVKFIVHTEERLDSTYYLDDVSLRGWVSGCAPSTENLVSEDFTGCPNPIVDGWNGWEVTGSPNCPGPWECAGTSAGPNAHALDEQWTMERMVDTTSVDGEVVLCFSIGDDDSGTTARVQFDLTDGSGWQTLWEMSGNLGDDNTCRQVCLNLSDVDPDAAANPSLWIRFFLNSNRLYATGHYVLDDILLSGSPFCDGSSWVSLGPVTETGGGIYDFTVTRATATKVSPVVTCSWGTPPAPLRDRAVIDFQ